MKMILPFLGSAFLVVSIANGQLPCNHPLRLSAPSLFTHCGSGSVCTYTPFSEWQTVPNSVKSISTSQCSSGKYYQERRTRTSTAGSSCTRLSETRRVCLPDKEDQLILALGLGGSDRDLGSVPNTGGGTTPTRRISRTITTPRVPNTGSSTIRIRHIFRRTITRRRLWVRPRPTPTKKCPANNNVGQICHHLTGKRSVSMANEFSETDNDEFEKEEEMTSADAPVPFFWNEHGPRLRRQAVSQQCKPGEVQNVLFVLDSSGSIGSTSYQRMKDAIGKLVPLFCKKVRFAMVTYSTNINLEFCFNCFQNTFSGRQQAQQAISRAKYHAALTKTGATTKCICDELLNPSCGIARGPSCLDVVYITDGKSNDGKYKVCQEINCLHRHSGINTYAIGINNFNQAELDCISDSSNLISAFSFNSFDAFEDSIDKIIQRLANSISDGNHYSCLQRDSSISLHGAVLPLKHVYN